MPSLLTRPQRYAAVLEWFAQHMPQAQSELVYANPYQLLVAVILSAQCTDKRVNLVTPALFAQYPTPSDLARATEEEVFALVRSVSYPHNKSKHLVAMARKLEADFGSEVPADPETLQQLPGVGRKTANVIASVIYNRPVIAVDTHVQRVARRLGLSRGTTPLAVEKDLTCHIPAPLRPIAHHWLILHGRYVCVARKPRCADCGLQAWCAHFQKALPHDASQG